MKVRCHLCHKITANLRDASVANGTVLICASCIDVHFKAEFLAAIETLRGKRLLVSGLGGWSVDLDDDLFSRVFNLENALFGKSSGTCGAGSPHALLHMEKARMDGFELGLKRLGAEVGLLMSDRDVKIQSAREANPESSQFMTWLKRYSHGSNLPDCIAAHL